jgi:hypothetical protein
MTLNSRELLAPVHAAISLIMSLSVVSHSLAQTPREINRARQSSSQEPQQTEEEKKAAEALEKKAMALVDETASEAMSLRLTENRVYILTGAAESLWKHDEERARALIREAMNQVIAHLREARDGEQNFDPRYGPRNDDSYLRGSVMNFLSTRDAKMALEFLQTLRSLRPAERKNPNEEYQERELEMNLASQIAGSDPQTALQIAEEYLNGKLDYRLLNIWGNLQGKDPKAASSLTEKMITQLKSRDILGDYETLNFVFTLLSHLKPRADAVANAQNNPGASNAAQLNPAEIRQAYRDALEIVAAAALKLTSDGMLDQDWANRARNLLSQIPGYLPDIEKLFPSRIAAVRAKIAQFDRAKYGNPHERFYGEYGRDLHTKPVQELLALAAKAPPEVRQNVYHQAVQKAMGDGDDETARRIIKENITDKWQASTMLSDIERRTAERSVGEGKYADARRSLARMATDEQRASALAGWATAAANKGDKQSAAEMLQEARAMIGSRMQRSDQLEAQMTIANAAVNLDPDASFEIAEAAIERINRLVAANLELQTFGGAEEGEIRIIHGGVWGGYSGSIVPLFAALARKDFDRAGAMLKQWQSPELRLMISLSLAQNILGGQGVGYGGGYRGSAVIRGSAMGLRPLINRR